MKHDEMIAVIKAHKEGKVVQYREVNSEKDEWVDATTPAWNFYECDYRVKPEITYRPWDKILEVPIGARVVSKDKTQNLVIVGCEMNEGLLSIFIGNRQIYPDTLFEVYEMPDGSPCGVMVHKGDIR
jgi:hypothetical protein